ncbi:GerAB/ArcD/ProY family transporter [Priestia taiwanensis]|uniref:Membrane protein n=1 Tax=Priestia taiwanensis TaxID=1347902 RepID=A0A917AK18_9BACI|nr:GerAB/ArcD/ProY family transporter [Priestia taiwanensis]MBM7361872.1 putative membrane protein YkvI [Priestia taiwanensis]GGE57597.1 membrane protein [Priestia taiwanensis]
MAKKQANLSFKIAATYIGTIVGAGFATGKEIVEFFTVHGLYGAIGILLSGILFIWLGTKMMLLSVDIQAFSVQEFNRYLFGNTVGTIINGITIVVLIGVTSVMLSGAGAVFEEQLHLNRQLGIILTVAISLLVLQKGIEGVFSVNVIVVPIMMLFIIGLSSTTFSTSLASIGQTIPEGPVNIKWFINPFAYVALNLVLAQSVLVPLAHEVQDKKAIMKGGILGGIGLCFILLSSHLAISSIESFHTYNIPMAEVIRQLNYVFHFLFIFIILGEIFTTVVGNVFGISKQLQSIFDIPYFIVVVVVICVAYSISFVSYSPLLSFLYPLIGWVSLAFLPLVAFKTKKHL